MESEGSLNGQDTISNIEYSIYLENSIKDPNGYLKKLSTIGDILDIITNAYDALELKTFYVSEIQDVATCYRCDQHPKYHVILNTTKGDITMEEIVNYCQLN